MQISQANQPSTRWRVSLQSASSLAVSIFLIVLTLQSTVAQTAAQPTDADELALDQSKIADQYKNVEELILRMAEYDQGSNPRRAELLKKAFALGKERDIKLQLEAASRLLNQDKYQRALDGQNQARKDLQALLELLLSENRSDRLKDEQARVRDYIREIERLERMQRSVQARTEGGVETDQIKDEQERVADRTEALERRIDENERSSESLDDESDEESEAGEDQQSGDGDPSSEGQSGDVSKSAEESDQPAGEPAEGAEEDDKPRKIPLRDNPLRPKKPEPKTTDSEKSDKPGESADPAGQSDSQQQNGKPADESQPGEPQQGEPQQGQSQQGQSPPPGEPGNDAGEDQAQPQQQDFPGRKRVEEAERHMREAEQKLAEAKRDGALEEQKEAAKKLAEAKAELEEILRQMREEEIERVLAALEVRFRRMLEMQLRVYEATMRVDKIPAQSRDRYIEIEAGKLSFQEKRIVVEADKCLNLLHEEGSSVAFPESVEQMREDMQLVTDRLAKSQVGRFTQGLEEDIIEALEEMIEALEKAQADQEERKQQKGQPQQGTPGDMPLVDAIAELKMLKALQLRINRRTTRYATLLDDADDPVGRATDEALLQSIQDLSQRQQRLHGITRDISLGKNK